MKPRHIPNVLSALRLALSLPIAALLLLEEYRWALALFLIAGVSDGIDGRLARHRGWTSWIGGVLDPLADKVLLVTVFGVLALAGHVPLWLAAAVVLREAVVVSGALLYHLLVERLPIAPTFLSKVNTLTQIIVILTVLGHLAAGPLSDELIMAGFTMAFVTTVGSGVDYVVRWSVRAVQMGRSGAQ